MKRLLTLFALFCATPAFACDHLVRAYNTATTVDFCLFITDATVGAVKVESAVHASGDTYIMKDEGNEANTTNGFVDEGSCYSIALTATEMAAARVLLNIEDQSTKTWADKCVMIETYGNASAQFPNADTSSVLSSGTAQSGSTSGSIVLASGASSVNNYYRYTTVIITGGTGAGQARVIDGYNGSTKAAVVRRPWRTTPDTSSTYVIYGTDSVPANIVPAGN